MKKQDKKYKTKQTIALILMLVFFGISLYNFLNMTTNLDVFGMSLESFLSRITILNIVFCLILISDNMLSLMQQENNKNN